MIINNDNDNNDDNNNDSSSSTTTTNKNNDKQPVNDHVFNRNIRKASYIATMGIAAWMVMPRPELFIINIHVNMNINTHMLI